jgi:iron complex transport system substrate-binding protein
MSIDEDGPALSNAQISPETLVHWNPDAIVVGRQYSPDIVTGDSRFAGLKAVRSKRVWSSPEGVWYWDGGAEQVLLLQFLAKRMYPDLFRDLDLAGEVKSYYARFYRTDLSDDEAAKLLDGRSPDGSRFNPMRN